MLNYIAKKWQLFVVLATFSLSMTACNNPFNKAPTTSPQSQINAAVVATIAAIPTFTPYPIPTPYPSPTLVPLVGMFCEYGFCIGHPTDMVFVDEGSIHKPPVVGSQSNGILFGYTDSLFIQFNWQISDPNYNPQTAMHLIMEEAETLQGSLDAILVGDLNVYYQPITTITPKLPFGAVAAWQCGGHDFVWKVYTPQDGMAQGVLKQSLEKFRCQ